MTMSKLGRPPKEQPKLRDFAKTKKLALQSIVKRGLGFFVDHHVSTKGGKMSFLYMPYLYKIYKDMNPMIIVQSSVQTGKSEWALIKGLSCVYLGLNVFHVFSTGEAKNSFVKSRINELCDRVPIYKNMEKDDRRNMYLRHMGKANWKFVISNSKSHFDEFPADVVIVDEYDSCNVENIPLADTRMENSDYKLKFLIGNPTVTNTGINVFYEDSTKNEWHFKCVECGKSFPADFFKIVTREIVDKDGNHIAYKLYDEEWNENLERDIYIKCIYCNCLQERKVGKWIAKNPESKISGYLISKIMKLNAKISEMWRELKDAEGNEYKMQIFYNKTLGRTYEGTGAKVTPAMLDRLTYDYVTKDMSSKPTIAGMDVGSKFDLQIDISAKHEGKRKRLLLNVFRCDSLDDVKDKIEEFNIKTLCVGIKPERHLMKTFREDMFGKCNVILIEETGSTSGTLKLQGFKENEDEGTITVDRTWLLDESMKNIKLKFNILPKEYRGLLGGYWLKSMEAITRIYQNDKEEYKWSKADNDHFRFADAFSMLAWMKTQDAILMGDDVKKTETKKTTDGRGNRIIPEKKSRVERIGIMKRRFGLGRKSEGRLFRK